jgi:hypothetical protein
VDGVYNDVDSSIADSFWVDNSSTACEAVIRAFSSALNMNTWGILALLTAVAFAGCTSGDEAVAVAPLDAVAWSGSVNTPAFNPIAGVTFTIIHPETIFDDGSASKIDATSTTSSDENGAFSIQIPPGTWNWTAEHPDYETAAGKVKENQTVALTLIPRNVIEPFQQAIPFSGEIECAAEYFIITPSCDTLIKFAGGPSQFRDNSVFDVEFDDDWATLVLDVQFDLADHPGIAGLRVSAYAADANAELFNYERFQQAVSAESFSLRLDPGSDYGDAVPTPSGAGGMRFEFYPHGHGDDTVCTPDECFLGVGVTYGLTFEAVATIFYHEAAPDGWTLLA